MKKKNIFIALALAVCIGISFVPSGFKNHSASALGPAAIRISVSSYNIQGNYLSVEYQLESYVSGTDAGTYALYYSSNSEHFPSGNNAPNASATKVNITDKSARFGLIRVDLATTVNVGDRYYFALSSVESAAGMLTGSTREAYTQMYTAEKAELDSEQAYFVDCGSRYPLSFDSSSTEASLTPFQSLTWQAYGTDAVTGKNWGHTTAAGAVANAEQRGLFYSTLNSSVASMIFKFEVEESTDYNIVIGLKDNSDSRLNAAGNVYVNSNQDPVGSYVGGYNPSVIVFENAVQGVLDNTKYYITIELRQADFSMNAPMCSFISIRKDSAATEKFITAGQVEYQIESGTKLDELPEKITVFTTGGEEELDVTYRNLSDASLDIGESTFKVLDSDMGLARPEATISYNSKNFTFPVVVNVWTPKDIYYFVDCVQFLPFSPSSAKHNYLKSRPDSTLLNVDSLDQQSKGSDDFGWFGDKPIARWGNVDPYLSLYEGEYDVLYNFPNLPAGDYVFEFGFAEPAGWGGARSLTLLINDIKLGETFVTPSGSGRCQYQFSFTQVQDDAPVFIKVKGSTTGRAMAGWMVIAGDAYESDETPDPTDPDPTNPDPTDPSGDNNQNLNNAETKVTYANLVLTIVLPIVILALGTGACLYILKEMIFKKKKKSKDA